MGIYRMYTGSDGQTHVEETPLAAHPLLTKPQAAVHIVFTEHRDGSFLDWHPAPRRQYVIVVSGNIEIGLGDGSIHRFGPGSARLVEDTTGQGHTTRYLGPGPIITTTIPLA
jgi:quercetin dioxygenase-like cupin family protein